MSNGREDAIRTDHVKLGEDGRIVIPAATRQELGFAAGDTLVLEADEGGLYIRTHAQVVRDVQRYFMRFARPGVSEVDELIADRRREFALEDARFRASGTPPGSK